MHLLKDLDRAQQEHKGYDFYLVSLATVQRNPICQGWNFYFREILQYQRIRLGTHYFAIALHTTQRFAQAHYSSLSAQALRDDSDFGFDGPCERPCVASSVGNVVLVWGSACAWRARPASALGASPPQWPCARRRPRRERAGAEHPQEDPGQDICHASEGFNREPHEQRDAAAYLRGDPEKISISQEKATSTAMAISRRQP